MKISIITATYNNEKTIEQTIQSVLNQNYQDIEYIIVDGDSTDDTLKIIQKYKNQISKIISEADKGMYDALNKGIMNASGYIIGFLHADDFYPTDNILEKVEHTFKVYGTQSVYGDLDYVAAEQPEKIIRKWISGKFNYDELKKGWMPPHPTFFVLRELYWKYGFFNLDYKIAADYDLMLRFLGKHKISTAYLPEVLVKMRWGGKSNKSIGNIILKSKEDYRALKQNNIGGLYSLFMKNFRKINQFF
ncbi:MAG: glycosyltransferase [Bacteroidales bacterium]|nr:glycosyltransferase [Bacteroidales bacterium]